MAQHKLYTKEMFLQAAEKCEVSMIDAKHIMEYIDEYVRPIKLPSDEEIKKEAKDNCEYNQDSLRQFDSKFIDTFIDGAKWMREQILNK